MVDEPRDSVLRFELLLADVSSRLIALHGQELDEAVRGALGELCCLLGADRATLFEFSEDGQRFAVVHWWAQEGLPGTGDLEAAQVPWYAGQLRAGKPVVAQRIPEDLPAAARQEREYASRTGLKSNVTVPILVGDRPVCALAAGAFREYRHWPEPVVRRVRLYGQILTAAVYRRRQEDALERGRAEIERLNRHLERENLYLREEIRTTGHADEIVGQSQALRQVLAAVERVGPTDSSVLLLGETGTGKELVARAVHGRSRRQQRPLVRLNCAALPSGLVESELFGHEKGAFTGAGAARAGRFEVADGGTLFLDEVGDLLPETQAKLLRVLQEGEFERLGSTRTRRVDVRLIAATNRDLEKDVKADRFRADLYYRLSVFPITIPPLRERREDIQPLVWFFIHQRQKELKRKIERIPPAGLEALLSYDWPGNVRELENVVERAMILSSGETLELEGAFPVSGRAAAPPPKRRDLDTIQRAHIETVLAECGWKINGAGNAAERLGLHPNTLRFRMRKLGIARPGPENAAPSR